MAKTKIFRVALFVILCGLIFAVKSPSAQALSGSWINSAGGDWSTGANWNSGVAPNGSSDNATFNIGSAPDITVDGTFSVNNLDFTGFGNAYRLLDAGGQINLFGNLTIDDFNDVAFTSHIALQHDAIFSIAPGGSLSLSAPDAVTGSHGFTLAGGGFISNSDPVSYSGTTVIQDGTFGSSGGNVFSPNSDFVLADNSDVLLSACGGDQTIASLSGGAASAVEFCGARLTLGNDLDTTYAGTMEDNGNPNGGITKVGTGKLTLTGTNTYTGATIVNDGTLDVNGSITNSAMTINAGATLKGSGTVKGVTMNGTVAPGNSIGTLHANTFEFTNGSTLQNEINPNGTTDLVSATSGVTIDPGAALNVLPQAGTYTAGQTYTIISAPSITGQFSSITGTSNDLTYQLEYFPTHVDLVVSPANGATSATVSAAPPATGYGSATQSNLALIVVAATSAIATAGGILLRNKTSFRQ